MVNPNRATPTVDDPLLFEFFELDGDQCPENPVVNRIYESGKVTRDDKPIHTFICNFFQAHAATMVRNALKQERQRQVGALMADLIADLVKTKVPKLIPPSE